MLVLGILALVSGSSVVAQETQVQVTQVKGSVARIVLPYTEDGIEAATNSNSFLRGAELAVKEVNSDGGLNGVQILLDPILNIVSDNEVTTANSVNLALKFADDVVAKDDLVAIVGHNSASAALTASSIYHLRGKLFLITQSTDAALANLAFDRVFMLAPNFSNSADAMARYALSNGLKRMVVLSDRSEFGHGQTLQLREFLTVNGGTVLHHTLLGHDVKSMSRTVLFILNNALFTSSEIDAFYISAGTTEPMVDFIKRARDLGLDQPILGPQHLFSADVERAVGKEAMKDVLAISLYDIESKAKPAQDFIASYSAAYDHPPDQRAAVGYDAIKLLAYAANQTKSLEPDVLSDFLTTMRYTTPYVGATGVVAFDENGRIEDTDIFVSRHDGTAFRTIANYQLPLPLPATAYDVDSLEPDSAADVTTTPIQEDAPAAPSD